VGVVLLGIGNVLMGDEGVGVHALRLLRERYSFPREVKLLDGGTMGLDLLVYLEGAKRLLILDALRQGAAPGTVTVLQDGQIPAALRAKLSVHQIGLDDVLFAMALRGKTPPEMCLVGVEPKAMGELCLELSPELQAALPRMLKETLRKLSQWGIEVRESVPGGTI